MRELHIGEVVNTVCFSYGRNLLASLKNYIVLIEAKSYLTVDYLQKLLRFAKQNNLSDPGPEEPVPLQCGEESAVNMMVQKEEEMPGTKQLIVCWFL